MDAHQESAASNVVDSGDALGGASTILIAPARTGLSSYRHQPLGDAPAARHRHMTMSGPRRIASPRRAAMSRRNISWKTKVRDSGLANLET